MKFYNFNSKDCVFYQRGVHLWKYENLSMISPAYCSLDYVLYHRSVQS